MRDPNRIKGIIERLQAVWERHPDLRLGQLLVNASHDDDPEYDVELFFMEDLELIEEIERMNK